jgi:toxin ParE1/3/4
VKTYTVRLDPQAEADLQRLYRLISKANSPAIARGYIDRILKYLAGFETFPERGTMRGDIRPGLRIVGFERRVTIGFTVEEAEVVVLNILYAGQQFP